MEKINVGIIGCGNISGIYLQNLTKVFDNMNVFAICDLDGEKTKYASETYGIGNVFTYDQIMGCPDIQIILNLTTPKSPYKICKDALLAGKNVYVEKPLSLELADGKELVALAEEKGLLIGCAPDTFLGAGIQTCIKAINDGLVGEVIGATAFMMCHGHESWHPDPEFYYEKGGGPMFDMGPYYLTALVSMIGPVAEAAGMNNITFPQRTITSEPKKGKKVDVEVPTHVTGLLRFENGAIGNIITTFDVWGSTLPRIEIYGSEGTLSVPDPNTFGGPVKIRTHRSDAWQEVPLTHGFAENSRGAGVSDLANAAASGRINRANGDLAYHVLDLMHAFHDASASGSYYDVPSRCDKPQPLGLGLSEHDVV